MCLGVATYIFMHVLVNLGGIFGVMPLTGVPLPFLSYGGSFTISLICSLALVQRFILKQEIKKYNKIKMYLEINTFFKGIKYYLNIFILR